MPPKKSLIDQSLEVDEPRLLRKRSYQELEPIQESDLETTPSKRIRSSGRHSPISDDIQINGTGQSQDSERSNLPAIEVLGSDEETPKATPRRRGRPPKNPKVTTNGDTPTPKANRTAIFETPTKVNGTNAATPRAADRSARRKSAKALIEHIVGDGLSDEDEDDGLARQIYDSSGEEDEGLEDSQGGADVSGAATDATTGDEATTPSKTTPRRRGRPPKKARSPTPPRDLPPHELYFTHNKPGRPKTSNNTLSSLALLTHEEYFNIISDYKDRHAEDVEYLENLHAESFPQWTFEMSQGFGICLYGFGSKRRLLQKFARHLHSRRKNPKVDKIVIVNGYASTTTLREILSSVGAAVDPSQRIPLSQPASMVQHITNQLSTTSMTLTIIINSIDAPPLRKSGSQAILAQLAAHPQIQLICSADTPDFSLLWDIGVRSAYNFLFHDCTTFAPFTVELDIVDEVHELLGRTARRVNGREGVAFVLRSLPENAKNLFRLIVGEVLIAMEEEGGEEETGVEYRMVYNKAVEEFICSSEMAFRTLLKE